MLIFFVKKSYLEQLKKIYLFFFPIYNLMYFSQIIKYSINSPKKKYGCDLHEKNFKVELHPSNFLFGHLVQTLAFFHVKHVHNFLVR